MQKTILYIAASLEEVYQCAYSILKYLDVYNLKPPADHSLMIYTNHPERLEAYGSFFHNFQLRPIASAGKKDIVNNLKNELSTDVVFIEPNHYPTNELGGENSLQCYKNLKEFDLLLKDFFGRYQEESVPNQVKLLHNTDAKKIEKQKAAFDNLPFTSKWLRKLTGKGWNISNYRVRI